MMPVFRALWIDEDLRKALGAAEGVYSEAIATLRTARKFADTPPDRQALVNHLRTLTTLAYRARDALQPVWAEYAKAHGASERALPEIEGCSDQSATGLAIAFAFHVLESSLIRSEEDGIGGSFVAEPFHLEVAQVAGQLCNLAMPKMRLEEMSALLETESQDVANARHVGASAGAKTDQSEGDGGAQPGQDKRLLRSEGDLAAMLSHPPSSAHGKRFRVALSFPGERRTFIEQVATRLASSVERERILYDTYHEAEFARPNLDTHLQHLYHDESELIAVFLCAEYEQKEWCRLEWRAIRDLIKRRQASTVMPFRFDDTEIPGLFSTDGYVSIGGRTPDDIAKLILERLRIDSNRAARNVS